MSEYENLDRRRQRSDETRERLLATGCRMFAARGFDATTTRALADAAGVNQAAILYHFGGKEGLYLAVADAIARRGREAIGPYLLADGTTRDTTRPAMGSANARAALGTLLGGLVRGLLSVVDDDGSAAAFLVREQASPGLAFDRLYRGYICAVHERVTVLVAAATGRASEDPAAILEAQAVIGMALGFPVAPETVRRRMGWPTATSTYPHDAVTRIEAVVRALADRALSGSASPPPPLNPPVR